MSIVVGDIVKTLIGETGTVLDHIEKWDLFVVRIDRTGDVRSLKSYEIRKSEEEFDRLQDEAHEKLKSALECLKNAEKMSMNSGNYEPFRWDVQRTVEDIAHLVGISSWNSSSC